MLAIFQRLFHYRSALQLIVALLEGIAAVIFDHFQADAADVAFREAGEAFDAGEASGVVGVAAGEMQGADVPGDYGDRVLGDPGKFRFVYLNAESRSLRYG